MEQLLRLLDGAGVDRVILAQPFSGYAYDNAYHADSAARYADRCVGICGVDPLAADAPDRLSYWIEERGMQGLRLFANQPADWLDDPQTYPLWERARALGIPICVLMREERLGKLRATATRFPEVPVALDHLAAWETAAGLPLAATQELLDLAELPNLYLKFSTANLAPLDGPLGEQGIDLFRRIVDRYGPRRLMWGSNFPVSQEGSYADMVAMGCRALPFLTDDDRRWLLADTALTLWPRLKGSAP